LIWLAWRQSRAQIATVVVVMAFFAVLLAVTGPQLAHLYVSSAIGTCQGGVAACGAYADDFLTHLFDNDSSIIGRQLYAGSGIANWTVTQAGGYWPLYMFGILVILAAPALIGIFWGAPLIAAELEAGTHYVAWTQTITRTRWLLVKLVLAGLTAVAVTEALSLMEAWWAAPISLAVARGAEYSTMAMNQFNPLVFATHGITPLGYAAFAFALGVTVGMLVRRAALAMALTLGIFAALQVAMPLWIRPLHLFPPDHTLTTLGSWASVDVLARGEGPGQIDSFTLTPGRFGQPEAWIFSVSGAVNTAGEPVSAFPAACRPKLQTGGSAQATNTALLDCLDSQGIRIAVIDQPASRYWAFQAAETAIYFALAVALLGYCFWRIRRRLS
jgi:hypothetical protein